MIPWRVPCSFAVARLPRRVAVYVLTVDSAAVAATLLLWTVPPFPRAAAWLGAGWLMVFALAGAEVSRHVERRRVEHRTSVYTDVHGTWLAALVVLFPPVVVCVATVVAYSWVWLRVLRRDAGYPAYKWVCSAASMILGTGTASVLFDVFAGPGAGAGGVPVADRWLLPAAVVSVVAVVVVNTGLVGAAIWLSGPQARWWQAVGGWPAAGLAAGCGFLGVFVAATYTASPVLVVLAVPILLVLQRALLVGELQAAARRDPKTGLANADWWAAQATRELDRARRSERPLSVLLGDLDHFKGVNDTWGHLAGDRVLRAVADALSAGVRPYDVVGRYGGEEFVVLLPATSPSDAAVVAERLRARVTATTIPESATSAMIGVTISLGVAGFPDHAGDLDGLVRAADTALYAAKHAGRDRVRLPPAPVMMATG